MTEAASTPAARDLVGAGVLDAELGGLLEVLLDGGLPLVVAGSDPDARTSVSRALAGRRADGVGVPVELAADGDPDQRSTARGFVAAAAEGLPVAATIDATDLEAVFVRLEAPPMLLTRDELSHVGVVVVLGGEEATEGEGAAEVRPRVVAAHWVRPLARDAHGHVQRLGPAVLATWDPHRHAWEHFAWGVMPELAIRLGRKAGDLDHEVAARAAALSVPGALS